MYENILGLSCVENHILATLKKRGMDISPLYHNCALSLREIFYFLVIIGEKQEYFDRVPRIQEVLKKLGVIKLVLKRQSNIQSVRNAIRLCKDNEYILLKVTPKFTKENLFARGFRDDHYVLVRANSDNFTIINDIPERMEIVTARQLTKAYGGDYFKLTVKRELTKNDTDFLWISREFKPDNQKPFYYFKKDLTDISNLGIKLRNMAIIYRILRYRMAIYYSMYVDTGFIGEVMPTIEKYYVLFEYYNLKKSVTIDKYYSILSELNETETKIMMELKYRLNNIEGLMEKEN